MTFTSFTYTPKNTDMATGSAANVLWIHLLARKSIVLSTNYLYMPAICCISDPSSSLPNLLNILNEFGQLSGYKVNYQNIELTPIGLMIPTGVVLKFCDCTHNVLTVG